MTIVTITANDALVNMAYSRKRAVGLIDWSEIQPKRVTFFYLIVSRTRAKVMTAQAAHTAEAWGRLTLVTKEPADDSDHIYLTRPVTTIGRNKRRCDHVINQLFISSVVR